MRKLLAALVAVLFSAPVLAANLPLYTGAAGGGCSEASQLVPCLNQTIQSINTLVTPQTMGMPSTPRNVIDNGAMLVQQRGTGTATCANNGSAIGTSNYAADRWGCEVNVGSGAGQLTPITSTPTPPVGFAQALKLVRNSGALLQAQCAYQEIPTYKATQMQGQSVVFSVNIQALAGLAADQGSTTQTANLLIITGTGTDQGFGTWTASPALTPAWTNVATAINTPVSLPTTPAWTRYSTTAPIGTTVTEIAVAVCFTPTATGSGTTDGIAFTGAQLEVGTTPSSFEFRSPQNELAEAQRYLTILTEPAAGINVPVFGAATAATTCTASYAFPVTMRAAPTFTALGTALSTSTWKLVAAGSATALASTFIVTATANGVSGASMTITSAGMTAGQGCLLQGNNAGSILSWSSDF